MASAERSEDKFSVEGIGQNKCVGIAYTDTVIRYFIISCNLQRSPQTKLYIQKHIVEDNLSTKLRLGLSDEYIVPMGYKLHILTCKFQRYVIWCSKVF